MLPTELEIGKFKERLFDYSIDSFAQIENQKHPYSLGKLEGPEKFVIDILKEESVIEKTNILWKIDKYSTTVYDLQGLIENWKYLEQYLVNNEEAAN